MALKAGKGRKALPKGADDNGRPLDVEVPEAIPRGRGGRPKIRAMVPETVENPDDPEGPPIETGRLVESTSVFTSYTRASSLGKTLDDLFRLHAWEKRTVLFGASRDRAIYSAAQAVRGMDSKEDKDTLDELVERAKDAGKGNSGSVEGTAFHALSERSDAGDDLSYLDDRLRAGLAVYRRLIGGLKIIATETFVVCDELEAAGSFDRVVELTEDVGVRQLDDDGEWVVVDVLPAGSRVVVDLKGLALDTPIPTPAGWSTMGELSVGDQVIGSDGRPCRVTDKSQVKRIGTYVVTFDDGAQVTCDREHLWWVMTGNGVASAREQVIGVEKMRDTLYRHGQRQHRVPVAQPLDLPAVGLPVDPYLFGCWLGDGSAAAGVITKDAALFDLLRADGHETGVDHRRNDTTAVDRTIETRTVLGLRTALREAGLLGHKAIPDAYLRASIEQRLALLRGLMDTDGTWNKRRRRVQFVSTDKALAEQVCELVLTLGVRAVVQSWTAKGFGVETTAYGVEFTPTWFNPFRLARKADRVEFGSGSRARHRIVKSVEPGPDVETACIAVDSPNSTYLCGREMVPTHNTNRSAKYFGVVYLAQQAVYAYGVPYTHAGGRGEWPDGKAPSRRWAFILHVPVDSLDEAGFYAVDLERGIATARLAVAVREERSTAATAFSPIELNAPAHPPAVLHSSLLSLISAAATPDELRELYTAHRSSWDAECTAAAATLTNSWKAAS